MSIRRPTILLALFALVVACLAFVQLPTAHAADPNPDCTLLVPANPLTAAGLATPYQLKATNRADGPCHEVTPTQSAFVEAAVLNPATGAIDIYHPLVVDKGDSPATPPKLPVLPTGAVVGIWFGSNGDTLRLAGAPSSVTGLDGSVFGQFSYINARAFFAAATRVGVKPPPLGKAVDGKPCPTTRDFAVVDQDQSDNVGTAYWTDGTSMSQVPVDGWTKMTNGSDEGLLANRIDPALHCTPWKLPSLDGLGDVSSLAANELSAAAHQGDPAALVPMNDPMTLVDGHFSPQKTNLYRVGVDQPSWPAGQNPQQYCTDIQRLGAPRIEANKAVLQASASPTAGVNLYDFLTARRASSLTALGCKVAPVAPPRQAHHGHRHPGRDD